MEGYLQKRGVRLALLILIILGSALGIYLLRAIFAPLLLAFFIAYILDPLADRLEASRLSRLAAVIIIFSTMTILLVGVTGVVGVYVARGAVSSYDRLAGEKTTEQFDSDLAPSELKPGVHFMDRNGNGKYDVSIFEKVNDRFADWKQGLPPWLKDGIETWTEDKEKRFRSDGADDPSSGLDAAEQQKKKILISALDQVWDWGEVRVRKWFNLPPPKKDPAGTEEESEGTPASVPVALPEEPSKDDVPPSSTDSWSFFVLSYLLLCPLYVFFFLLQIDPMVATTRKYLPAAQRDRLVRIFTQIDQILSAFFRGRLIVCLVKGAMTALGLLILDVPFWLPLGLSAGFLSLIPYIGVYVSLIPAVLLSWFELESYGYVIAILALYGAMEAIEGFVLIPKFLGKEVGLHPLTIVVTLVIFGKLFGFFGVLLSVPLAAVTKILAREFILPVIEEFADIDEADRAGGSPAAAESPPDTAAPAS